MVDWRKEIDSTSPYLEFERLVGEAITFSVRKTISKHALPSDLNLANAIVIDLAAEGMVVELSQIIYGKHIYDEFHYGIDYPTDWWQAFKERWFPMWARNRWWVKKERIRTVYRRYNMCPHIKAKDNEKHIEFMFMPKETKVPEWRRGESG